jgi:hypothetical protein
MFPDILRDEIPTGTGPEKRTTLTPDPVPKPSRRARNDQKWESLKDEIRLTYMTNDFTLQNTRRIIEERHAFKARYRHFPRLQYISL